MEDKVTRRLILEDFMYEKQTECPSFYLGHIFSSATLPYDEINCATYADF